MRTTQPDLFSQQQADRREPAVVALEEPPADFVDRIRSELGSTLQVAREATAFPWPDLTSATLAELRFHSIARWLPEAEAGNIRAAFDAEMARLYSQHEAGN